MRVAIVGGTGGFGRPLAARIAALGHEVAIGSRDAGRAHEAAAEIGVTGGTNEEIVRDADLVILAVKSQATLDTATGLAAAIGEKPVLCVASNLTFTKEGVLPGRHLTSLAEEVAAVLAGSVAAGFHSLAAAHLASGEPPDEDVLVCGAGEAKALSLELGEGLVRGRAVDAGPLPNARGLEGMTAVILNINKRYRTAAGIRVTGLP